MPDLTPTTSLALGFLFGMRHALEPDHLAAVSSLLAGGRKRSAAALVGAFWGVGHTLSILAVGGLLLALRLTLPDKVQAGFETAVAAMLVGLGLSGLWRAYRLRAQPGAEHRHGAAVHAHGGGSHVHVGPFVVGWRPLAIGLIHGLAGTGALAALVMASLPSAWTGLAYLASFGLGSVGGMALLTFLAELPLRRLRSAIGRALLFSVTGLASTAFGVYWAIEQLPRLH